MAANTMPSQESLNLLDTLKKLRREDLALRASVLELVARLRRNKSIDLPMYKRWDAATRERHDARSRSYKAFEDSINESQARASLLTAEVERQELAAQRAWLKALEDEVQEEQLLAHPTGSNRISKSSDKHRKQQLTVWEAKVAPNLERRKKALAIVLRYKADEHSRREARVAMIMRRLVDPAFPRELLLMIIEAATGSRCLYWWPSEDHTLDMLADSFFLWPCGVENETRIILRQTVADVLLKAFLTKILLRIATQDTLMVPLSLNGNSVHVRRLVFELPPMFLDGRGSLFVGAADIRGIELLQKYFPRLETCVCLLRLGAFWTNLQILSPRKAAAVKKRLAEIFAAFLKSGPGRRKFIRCGDTSLLVEHNHHEALGDANVRQDAEETGDGEDLFALSSERIVEQAHTLHRQSVW